MKRETFNISKEKIFQGNQTQKITKKNNYTDKTLTSICSSRLYANELLTHLPASSAGSSSSLTYLLLIPFPTRRYTSVDEQWCSSTIFWFIAQESSLQANNLHTTPSTPCMNTPNMLFELLSKFPKITQERVFFNSYLFCMVAFGHVICRSRHD